MAYKVLLLVCLCCHGSIQAQTFDPSVVAFSRYGSYMSLRTAASELDLHDLTATVMWSETKVLRIAAVDGNDTLPVTYSATPLALEGKAAHGKFRVYFESPRILHLTAEGINLQMTGQYEHRIFESPAMPGSFVLHERYMVLTPKKGTIRLPDTQNDSVITFTRDAQGRLDIVLEQYYGDWVPRKYTEDSATSMKKLRTELAAWNKAMPSVPEKYQPAAQLASYLNWSCVYEPRENITRYGMAMSKARMIYIWSWDHCFNALSLSYGLPKASWDQFMLLFDHQDPQTGALPDLISSEAINWKSKKPPVHGWILSLLSRHITLTPQQQKEAYDRLSRWTDFWMNQRNGNAPNLPEYYMGMDAGWDNGTAFDRGGPFESPDLATYLVLQMEELAHLATALHHTDAAAEWMTKSKDLTSRLIKRLWTGEKFVTRKVGTGAYDTASRSLMSYLPLLLGKRLPAPIRATMIADLKKEGYLLTPYGLASESPQSKLYEPNGYWRGPIWAPNMVIMAMALRDCGEEEFAREIAKRFCDNCMKAGFAENYDALTGAPLCDPTYTWTSSAFLVLAHEL